LKVPFFDLKAQYKLIESEILSSMNTVCESSDFTNGKAVKNFEQNFAKFCSTKYAVALNNGTSALHLAMIALGIGKGDEVIIPANTFIATAWAPNYVGAKTVFVDCDPNTWQISIPDIEKKITKKTKCIIGVHLYGQPFDVNSLKDITQDLGIFLVEDASQAHGAKYKNQIVGGLGELACFSFYPSKNLGTYGEGGGITTNSKKFKKNINLLRNHGSDKKYYHDLIGFNMKMGGLESTVLNIKLRYLKKWNKKRKIIAKKYMKEIKGDKIKKQSQPENTDSVHHLFVITTNDRKDLIKYLKGKKIHTGIHYPIPCHLQRAFDFLGHKRGDFPSSEYLADHCLSLPLYPEMTDKMVEKVIKEINAY